MVRQHYSLLVAIAVLAVIAATTIVAFPGPTTAVAMQAATPAASTGGLATVPAAATVQVDPKTTALLLLDFTSTICGRPSCQAALPAAAALLKKARDAGALVVYSDTPGTSTILPQVAQQSNEPKVTGRADKFFGTNLDETLKGKGIKTVVIAGYVANGAVLYTAFGANVRGYTAVVAEDGTGAEDPFIVTWTYYQLLNQPGLNNPQNQPLVENRVTLSKSDLISFVPGAPAPKPLATAQAGQAQGITAPTVSPTQPPAPTAASVKSGSGPILDMDVLFPPGDGRDLVLDHCMSCHSMAPTVVAQKTPGEWKQFGIVHRDKVISLTDDEFNQLLQYLINTFNPSHPVPQLPEELLSGWTNY